MSATRISKGRRCGAALADLAERQGYRVKATRKGWTVYGKDGQRTVGFHRTPSDHRAFKNIVAELRKIGVQV